MTQEKKVDINKAVHDLVIYAVNGKALLIEAAIWVSSVSLVFHFLLDTSIAATVCASVLALSGGLGAHMFSAALRTAANLLSIGAQHMVEENRLREQLRDLITKDKTIN